MKLVNKKTGEPLVLGQTVFTRSGDRFVLRQMQKPHKPASTGRVVITPAGFPDAEHAYFPSVIGAEWIEREDRA